MEQLLAQQNSVAKQIQKITTGFKKDPSNRKTKMYAETRLQSLNQAWTTFEKQHGELMQFKDIAETNYVKENYYAKVETIYDQTRDLLEDTIRDAIERTKSSEKIEEHLRNVKKQTALIESLIRSIERIEKDLPTQTSAAYYTQKIQLLNSYWEKVISLHSEIMGSGKFKDDYFDNDVFSQTEDKYQAILIKIQEKINDQPSGIAVATTASGVKKSNMKLPRIDIPVFDGNYLKWPSFKDLFTELVHKDKTSTKAEKLFYLKTNLSGEPNELIRHLSITNENYDTAWSILEKRYDNKRILVTAQLRTLLNQPELIKESAEGLKKLHDTATETLQAIKNLGIEISHWDSIVIFLLTQKLDKETHRLYEQSLQNPREVQTLIEFLRFLENRFQGLEAIEPTKRQTIPRQNDKNEKHMKIYHSTMYGQACAICKGTHKIYSCEKLSKMSVDNRIEAIHRAKLCTNCLVKGHFAATCKSWKRCKTCNKKHHTLLHSNSYGQRNTKENDKEKEQKINNPSSSAQVTAHLAKNNIRYTVLLATAIIKVMGKNGSYIELRALVDQGAQCSFITEDAAQQLRLPKQKIHAVVTGVGESSVGNVQTSIELTIKPRFSSTYSFTITAMVLRKLTKVLPSEKITPSIWSHTRNLVLADPNYDVPGKIDIILGADVLGKILLDNVLRGVPGAPIAQQTELGWILSGEVHKETSSRKIQCFVSEIDISKDLRKLWEIEELQRDPIMTSEEMACENYYRATTRRRNDGQYIVRIPFRENPEKSDELSESREIALARLFQMERKFKVDKKFESLYKNFMHEYQELGHMVPTNDNLGKRFYLPHHAVLKDSSTTKLRVVFDASAKRGNKKSINDYMMVGPQTQQKLAQILLRWRKHKIIFTADIEKMYRQVKIDVRDQDYQRILWRDSQNKPIQEYKLTTVTYGTASAPFLAVRTLQQLARDDESKYPAAAKVILHDTYVDDVVSGSNSEEEAIELSKELIKLLKGGGFNLRKWTTNSRNLLKTIPWDLRETEVDQDLDQDKTIKALGVYWSPSTDKFVMHINENIQSRPFTKRNVLSEAAKVFDPIGLLAPVTVTIKLLLQDIWYHGTNWDEKLPTNLLQCWMRIRSELPKLKQIEIPRWIDYTRYCKCQLHGFSDASEKAYSAVVYIRTLQGKKISTHLLTAKTKVAPLQSKLSLPKLELCGATLLANLLQETIKSLDIDDLEYYAWTDSTTVLSWLQQDPHKLKTFVANRVIEIHSLTDCSKWNHVKSKENPADVASRGLYPALLKNFSMWWEGPYWLKREGFEPPPKVTIPETNLERRTVMVNTTTSTSEDDLFNDLLKRHSSLGKLQRVIAYCKRFIANSRVKKEERMTDSLTINEVDNALLHLIKYTQKVHFDEEIRKLSGRQELRKESRLLTLTPFLDHQDILRVGGRLENADMNFNQKHPIILPYKSELTTLIMDRAHRSTLHGGNALTMEIIRQKYWILNGLKAVKGHIHKCTNCHRYKAQMAQQMMGMLPKARVVSSPPFTHSGVDYAGPFDLLLARGRGNKTHKGYISIFVCLTTKAIHIEVVTDLTAKAFIAAFRRFVSRRGPVAHIYSDNATNFVGASRIISDLHKQESYKSEVNQTLLEVGTQWHFIPPASPHFGGLWEAGVKSIKHHMRRVIGETHLTYEEMCTLMTQIEACLNSRPLCPLSEDPESLDVLTPGHFLTGSALLTVPEKDLLHVNPNILNKWDHLEKMYQDFWNKWSIEYIGRLQHRPRWTQKQTNIKKGNIVLIKEESLPPSRWAIGRVIETHPGTDGLTRVVILKTQNGTLKRPITKVSLLPIIDNKSELDPNIFEEISEDEKTPSETQLVANIATISHNEVSNNQQGRKRKESEDSFDHHSTKRNRNEPSTSTAKAGTSRWTYLCIFALLFLVTLGEEIRKPYNITEFQNQEGIYFDHIAEVQLYSSEWNLLIYFDLSVYWKEFFGIKKAIRRIGELCDTHEQVGLTQELCTATITQLKHQMLESEHMNEVLYQQNENIPIRNRRAPLEIIGTAANKLFGILDQDFADKYEQQIEGIKENENLFRKLLKNQTSIMENTINIIKKNHNSVQHQLNVVENQIETIMKYINHSDKELLTTATFNSAAVLLTLSIIHLQSVQQGLLSVVTDTKHGRINTFLLTPSQLNDHLKVIREHLPRNVRLPGNGSPAALLTIYNSMSVKVRITNKRVLFDTRIPLLNLESFQLYKLIPIPVLHSRKQIYIQPTTTYLAVNSHKDRFSPLTEEEVRACQHITEGQFMCNLNHPIFTPKATKSRCEIEILNNQRKISPFCNLRSRDPQETWIKLHAPSSWIYITVDENRYNVICGETTHYVLLRGTGIFQIEPGCMINHPSFYISSNDKIPDELHLSFISESQILSRHLNLSASNTNFSHPLKIPQLVNEVNNNDLSELENAIREQQQRIDNIPKLDSHDLHHYSSTYVILGIITAIGLCYWWKSRKSQRRLKINSVSNQPQPAPRRSIHNEEQQSKFDELPSFHLEHT